MNQNYINYYNTNSLLIKTPTGNEYGGISAWQGIRLLGSNIYLICGTTNPTPNTGSGIIYIGEINCINGDLYYLNFPKSLATSVYGPDYDLNTGIYSFVGSYLDYNQNTNGFIYQGSLDNLTNSSNFTSPSINQYFNINFFHSYSNGLFVGNSGNKNEQDDTVSYIYDINNLTKIKTIIQYPNSITTTTYGICYNKDNIYTIVGGYSNTPVSIDKIYTNDGIVPIGNAFIADYNSETNSFFNWTTVNFGDNLLTHFEGISNNIDDAYSINADIIDLKISPLPTGFYLTIGRDKENNFVYNVSNTVKILYNGDGISSSNSVADNMVVGLYIGKDGSKVSYQAEIINNAIISKTNKLMKMVEPEEIIKFDNTFIENNYIDYKDGEFTFLENGTFFISFNIYIENTNLASIKLNVEYTINGEKNSFIISQKGIDEFGTGTAHSLIIPCSFINKFTINDIIKIRNVSDGSINFISNYVENAINGIISIYKL